MEFIGKRRTTRKEPNYFLFTDNSDTIRGGSPLIQRREFDARNYK